MRATVISNVRLSADYNVLTIATPEVGALTEPGQFVMLKTTDASDPMLRRPFSVFEVLRDDLGTVRAISILNKRAGRTTGLLYGLEAGDPVWCLGPLGLPFNPPSSGEAWMVAGGVGLAPFATLAEALVALGVKGRVTVPLEASLKALDGPGLVTVYACGPEPMLAAVATLAARYGQSSEVSMERTMGCGLGGCYSCVVPVTHADGQTRFVRSCIGGPVFDGATVVWE